MLPITPSTPASWSGAILVLALLCLAFSVNISFIITFASPKTHFHRIHTIASLSRKDLLHRALMLKGKLEAKDSSFLQVDTKGDMASTGKVTCLRSPESEPELRQESVSSSSNNFASLHPATSCGYNLEIELTTIQWYEPSDPKHTTVP